MICPRQAAQEHTQEVLAGPQAVARWEESPLLLAERLAR